MTAGAVAYFVLQPRYLPPPQPHAQPGVPAHISSHGQKHVSAITVQSVRVAQSQ